ncbi:MAG TPA: DUF4214 domain-containing protein [Acidimicrobiales bacterium]|nr:DUF4214 domain-containing protein [Acidimicrobiales bacterium]
MKSPRQLRHQSCAVALALAVVVGSAVSAPPAAHAAPAAAAASKRSVVISYSVGSAGHTSTSVEAFASRAARTLRALDGWSLGGSITFTRVASNALMHLLITDPAVLGATPGCSSTWSCRVGSNVYINEARWKHGTPTWTLGLDAYRDYVVNHEVGHFLGLGHVACPGAGRPAPVMMQQSKGAAPCVNRVWPLGSERQQVAHRYGVAVLAASPASSRYVGTAYLRTLQRWPSPLEAHLTGIALDRGTLGRTSLLTRLLTSAEFERAPAMVIRLYESTFDRRPDVSEMFYWSARLQSGGSPHSVAAQFAASEEFHARYDRGGTAGLVEALYANVLGRPPDPAGARYWTEQIDQGSMTRGQVLYAFSESAEHRARTHHDVLVQGAYLAILDRPADPAGLDYWTTRLDHGTRFTEMVAFLRTQGHIGL